jgi:3-deoxy-manno-octulosonate cytidylyltransferase (CMP-KDO synthetase)
VSAGVGHYSKLAQFGYKVRDIPFSGLFLYNPYLELRSFYMSPVIVIPARWASTRLPQKMLLDDTGWPLIRHTYEQAIQSTLAQRVIVATDDERIFKTVKAFGAEVVMTDPNHPTGTDRLAEVATKYLKESDLIINVQGDEPELEPENIDALIRLYQATDAAMATLVTPFPENHLQGSGSPYDPNCVKAVLGAKVISPKEKATLGYQALYFSRSPIPYPRDENGIIKNPSDYYMHLGIYAYVPAFLKRYVNLPQGRLELTEKLEQLRILENGYKIVVAIVDKATPGIDTKEDYANFVKRYQGAK